MIDKSILTQNFNISNVKNDNNFSPMSEIEIFEINIIWEILYGCSEKCKGCYVDKFDESTLTNQEKEVDFLHEKLFNYKLRENEAFKEIILSPTDITNNLNIDTLIKNQKFIDILNMFTLVTFTGSFLTSNEDMMKFIKWKNELIPTQNVEFLVAFDIYKILSKDKLYFDTIKKNIDLVFANIKGHFEYTLMINMKPYEITEKQYFLVLDILKEEFGAICELNPSFFRTHKKEHIKNTLKWFKTFFSNFKNKTDIILTHRNLHHAEFSYNNVLVKGLQLYKLPFLYENAVLINEDLEMDDNFNIKNNLVTLQLEYIKDNNLDECLNCELLYNCLNRNVISIMKHYKFKECVVPKECIIPFGKVND